MTLREIESALDEADAQVVGLVRNEVRMNAPQAGREVLAGDILIIEAEAEALASALSSLGLTLEEAGFVGCSKRNPDGATTARPLSPSPVPGKPTRQKRPRPPTRSC